MLPKERLLKKLRELVVAKKWEEAKRKYLLGKFMLTPEEQVNIEYFLTKKKAITPELLKMLTAAKILLGGKML